MNSFWVVVIGAVIITAAYNLYAKRIDRTVIQADASTTTPARMYMDGADFVPTSRFVLYGYHFKSIAAAGPIVGVITAAALWGWLPAIIWLMLGVSFIGWASDYSAIMVAVRNDGNSLSAIAHRLITPRTRTILFVFIFFYLLLVGAAFVGIMAAILDARPDVPFGVLVLALMGLLAGYMIYRARANLMLVTAVVVGATLVAMTLGPIGVTFVTGKPPTWSEGPTSGVVNSINRNVNGGGALYGVQDPTGADPRITRDAKAKPISSRTYDAKTGTIQVFPATCCGRSSCWCSATWEPTYRSGGSPNRSTTSGSGSRPWRSGCRPSARSSPRSPIPAWRSSRSTPSARSRHRRSPGRSSRCGRCCS